MLVLKPSLQLLVLKRLAANTRVSLSHFQLVFNALLPCVAQCCKSVQTTTRQTCSSPSYPPPPNPPPSPPPPPPPPPPSYPPPLIPFLSPPANPLPPPPLQKNCCQTSTFCRRSACSQQHVLFEQLWINSMSYAGKRSEAGCTMGAHVPE